MSVINPDYEANKENVFGNTLDNTDNTDYTKEELPVIVNQYNETYKRRSSVHKLEFPIDNGSTPLKNGLNETECKLITSSDDVGVQNVPNGLPIKEIPVEKPSVPAKVTPDVNESFINNFATKLLITSLNETVNLSEGSLNNTYTSALEETTSNFTDVQENEIEQSNNSFKNTLEETQENLSTVPDKVSAENTPEKQRENQTDEHYKVDNSLKNTLEETINEVQNVTLEENKENSPEISVEILNTSVKSTLEETKKHSSEEVTTEVINNSFKNALEESEKHSSEENREVTTVILNNSFKNTLEEAHTEVTNVEPLNHSSETKLEVSEKEITEIRSNINVTPLNSPYKNTFQVTHDNLEESCKTLNCLNSTFKKPEENSSETQNLVDVEIFDSLEPFEQPQSEAEFLEEAQGLNNSSTNPKVEKTQTNPSETLEEAQQLNNSSTNPKVEETQTNPSEALEETRIQPLDHLNSEEKLNTTVPVNIVEVLNHSSKQELEEQRLSPPAQEIIENENNEDIFYAASDQTQDIDVEESLKNKVDFSAEDKTQNVSSRSFKDVFFAPEEKIKPNSCETIKIGSGPSRPRNSLPVFGVSPTITPKFNQSLEISSLSNAHKRLSTDFQDSLTTTEELKKYKMAAEQGQQEISDLKLELNACKQAKASLELEISKKDEIVLITQAEFMKKEQLLHQDIKILKEQLSEKNSSTKDLEEALKEANSKEPEVITELHAKYADIMSGYQKVLKEADQKIETLKGENDVLNRHLANMELSFSDVHQKYERAKQVIEGLKANEEVLEKKIEESTLAFDKQEEKYERLKAHAIAQLDKGNKEVSQMRNTYESEINKHKAINRRLEIKAAALETSLEQKTKECIQLSALCDEVTGKKM